MLLCARSIADGAEHAAMLLCASCALHYSHMLSYMLLCIYATLCLLRLTMLNQHSPHPTDAQLLKVAATNRIERG
jgi:hypothetical protein